MSFYKLYTMAMHGLQVSRDLLSFMIIKKRLSTVSGVSHTIMTIVALCVFWQEAPPPAARRPAWSSQVEASRTTRRNSVPDAHSCGVAIHSSK